MQRSMGRVLLGALLVVVACSDPVTPPADSYAVTTAANPPAGGVVAGGDSYAVGATVTVTATAAAGYTFVNWTEGGEQVSTSPTYTFVAGTSRALVANFMLETHVLTVAGTGMEDGTVTSSPAGINCVVRAGMTDGSCTAAFVAGTTVTLTAEPAAGHSFTGWSGACSGAGECTISMTQPRGVMAGFAAQPGLLDGEHFTLDGVTRYLVHGGQAYRYVGNGTFQACTGNFDGSASIVRQLDADPGLPAGGVLPDIGNQLAPFSAGYWRLQWMSGRVPVRSTATGAVYVVVGCVRSRIDDAVWDAISGRVAIDESNQALLDALPEGPPATAPLRQPGRILIGHDHEAFWVTGPHTAYRVSNLEVLRAHCNASATRVTEAELARYTIIGILPSPMQPCAAAPAMVLEQPDFRMPVRGGRDWQLSRGFSSYIASGMVSLTFGVTARNDSDEVLAAASGVVDRIFENMELNAHGLNVTIRHDDGDGRFLTYYARLAPGSVTVQVGQRVERGATIGRIGDVAYSPGDAFLHFEVRREIDSHAEGLDLLPTLRQVVVDGRRLPEYFWTGSTAAFLSTNER